MNLFDDNDAIGYNDDGGGGYASCCSVDSDSSFEWDYNECSNIDDDGTIYSSDGNSFMSGTSDYTFC